MLGIVRSNCKIPHVLLKMPIQSSFVSGFQKMPVILRGNKGQEYVYQVTSSDYPFLGHSTAKNVQISLKLCTFAAGV